MSEDPVRAAERQAERARRDLGESLKYRRVLLKLSGEALAGDQGFGISPPVVDRLTEQVVALHKWCGDRPGDGVATSCAVPGSQEGMDRVSADYMGMLATVINALALRILDRRG